MTTRIAEKIQSLTPEQRSQLMGKLMKRGEAASEPLRKQAGDEPAIAADLEGRRLPFPLTEIQEAYWVGRKFGFDLGNVAAHGYLEIDCRNLDRSRFTAAWNRLIVRHDMLRAVFLPEGLQRIQPEVPFYELAALDLVRLAAEEKKARLEAVRAEMSHQVLDAEQWPLFDLRYSLIDGETTRLHVSIDVLIFDAMSFDILSQELSILYADPAAVLPEIRISYRDYVLGAIRKQESPQYAAALEYWKRRIAELPPGPDLPLARAPRSILRPVFRRRTHFLDSRTWTRLKAIGQEIRCTPSAMLMAVYADVIRRWSSRKDFTLNVTLFNRLPLHPDIDLVVGDFTSVVLVAVGNPKGTTFSEKALEVQQRLWQDMDHGIVSGVRVMRELVEAKGQMGGAQMPVVFTSAIQGKKEYGAMAPLSWLGDPCYTVTQTPQVWLDFQVTEDRGGLVCDWDAVEELFPAGLLDDMFATFTSLLRELCADRAAWSRTLQAGLPAAQAELIATTNQTMAPVPAGLLHEPFLLQARSHPGRPAVLTRGRALTYGEVHRRSNQIANLLRSRETRPNRLVAVLMRKGWEQVVAVLGILEAGQAYLPLDPDLPADRLRHILEVCEVREVLTQAAALKDAALPAGLNVTVVDGLASDGWEIKPLPAVQSPDDLAYVIFTSGSTGLPKGVVIDHRGALNTVVDVNSRFGIGAEDRVLSLSSLSFDLSVYDIFGLLSAGGAVVIPEPSRHPNPGEWAGLIRDFDVTLWNTVPALLDMLMVHLEDMPVWKSRLRTVMMSGDWIPLPLTDRIRSRFPEAGVFSLGGATEASIWSIIYPIGRIDPEWKSIPYGKPMLNQSFHVLDGHLKPCPVHVQGDLYIGGIGLAKGYWKDEAKTSAAFITFPDTLERLYRTGDQGRLLPDGNIEFLGRNDFQVKINGFRVELGEIEAVLLDHPGVKQGIAHVVGERDGARRVIAYVVPSDPAGKPGKPETSGEAGPALQGYKEYPVVMDPHERLRFKLQRKALRDSGPESAGAPALTAPAHRAGQASMALGRKSHRRFEQRELSLEELSGLLSGLREEDLRGQPKYAYGSAGGLYPVQTYLYLKSGAVSGFAAGTYYYHPKEHRLIPLAHGELLAAKDFVPFNRSAYESASLAVFLIADMSAIAPLYGAYARDFCLLEAGLITQTLENASVCGGVGLCQMGAFDFSGFAESFRLTRDHEFLHCLVGGPKLPVGAEDYPEESGAGAPGGKDDSERVEEPLSEGILRHMRAKLPHYMVPSRIMMMEKLPLSSNGKVDRNALPAADVPREERKKVFQSPRTELEKAIAEVWREVLKVDAVGVHDNFFDLGGTSVHMVNIHTRLRKKLDKEVSLLDMFFSHPNIQSFVAFLADDGKETASPAPGREDGGRDKARGRQQKRLEARATVEQ